MNSLKDRIDEIIADLNGRFRNPLILTFLLVWLYYHWVFIYEIATIDHKIIVFQRKAYFQAYVKGQGWCGMVGYPILVAVGSLISFYLIGVFAQFIKLWLGKRLPAAILAKYDTGKYELKALTEKYKTKVKSLEEKDKINSAEIEELQSKLRDQEASATQMYSELSSKYIRSEEDLTETRSLNKNLQGEIKESKLNLEVAQNLNEKYVQTIEDLQRELNIKGTDNEVMKQQLDKLNSEAQASASRISHDMSRVFERGSQWRFILTKKNGGMEEEIFEVLDVSFYVRVERNPRIAITDFSLDPSTKRVYFKKSSKARGYENVETNLIFFDKNNLVGFEGDGIAVRYQKVI
jgi:hypothetical protein